MMKKIFVFGALFVFFFFPIYRIFAQEASLAGGVTEEIQEARIRKIIESQEKDIGGKQQLYQKLELLITKGSLKNDVVLVENGALPMTNVVSYKEHDAVMVTVLQTQEGKQDVYISDYIRRGALFWLVILFVACAILIGRWRGALSLVGMGISFLVIFLFILPQISKGSHPVVVAIFGSLVIIPVTFLLSHGWNKKTLVAMAGTLITLIFTGILASIFVEAAKLTGFASEEAAFLEAAQTGVINMKGLLLSGIIIGVLGVLDDITVSQAAIVFQLREANPSMRFGEVYRRAMSVGQDHISSMVNTLVLAYTGAALPLLLLFVHNPRPFSEVINYEIIADEIVRTLVGSIGLILAVPITTYIAALVATGEGEKKT